MHNQTNKLSIAELNTSNRGTKTRLHNYVNRNAEVGDRSILDHRQNNHKYLKGNCKISFELPLGN